MKKSLSIKRTAHYNEFESSSREFLIVIHGYGQLAEDFIEEFSFLKDRKVGVIAPEAISKFYNKERKAVASWMTAHEREDEIKDYVNYLEHLVDYLVKDSGEYHLRVLGFSQGVSTTLRWISQSKYKIEESFLCSGSIPPELDKDSLSDQSECQFHYFYGDHDPLLKEEKAKSYVGQLAALSNHVRAHAFEGSHEISEVCKGILSDRFS